MFCAHQNEGFEDMDSGHPKAHHKNKKGSGNKNMDISLRFYDNYNRAFDSLKKSLDDIQDKYYEQDAAVNFGVGFVESKKLTHGISIGGICTGVYGGTDLVYNQNNKEYLLVTRMGEVLRYDWAGSKLGSFVPARRFSKFLHIPQSGHYVGYNPGKSTLYIFRDDWTVALDTVSISKIDKISYGGRKTTEENTYEFFISSGATLNKYSYNPSINTVTLQESLKISDIEAENAEIEKIAFDQPLEDKKQWIYLTFEQHVCVLDVTGRVIGTKKYLHKHHITAIVAYGASDFVVTGDEKGLLKMWGTRWTLLAEVHPHTSKVTHLIEHPNGGAVLSFSGDQTIFAWSFDSKLKLESMKAPEVVEIIAINPERKAFMTSGPRKLVLWKMDVLFSPLTQMSSPVCHAESTWNPTFPTRIFAYSTDNSIRIINPVSGRILKSALVNPPKPTLSGLVYIPQHEAIFVLKTSADEGNLLELQIFDGTQNPCRLKETWTEAKWYTGVTSIALYDYHSSVVIPEKGLSFTIKKQAEITEAVTFIIAGMNDGCISKINIQSGHIEYKTCCHKGQVNSLAINPELNQFASLGSDPSVRLWKVEAMKEDLFVPLMDISWKYPIRHVAIVREVIAFALSHHDHPTHKVVVFNMLLTERYDHRLHFGHQKEVISISACTELLLFCSASKDETIRVWNEQAELVRLLVLNWIPVWAGFGTKQGDILCGIGNQLHVIPADKYLSVIYRSRAMLGGLNAGLKELAVPLNARSAQDPRMYQVLEEEDRYEREAKERAKQEKDKKKAVVPEQDKKEKKKVQETDFMEEKIPQISPFQEPKDSQRSQDYGKFIELEEDLKLIVEGKHQFSIKLPDFRAMSKKQLDEYGRSIFPDDAEKRKMFASEARIDCQIEMDKHAKELDSVDVNLL